MVFDRTVGPFTLLLATTGRGVELGEKTGDGWGTARHLTELDVRSLAVTPDGVALAGSQGDGVWRSDDAGVSWHASGLPGRIVKSLSFCAAQPNVVYAGTKPPLVYRSEDAGRTWRELESFRQIRGRRLWRQPAERPSTPYVQAIACSPGDPDIVVAGMEAGAVVRTEDGGRTWSNHLKGAVRDCHSLFFHPDGTHVYEGGGAMRTPGIAISVDGGETWARPTDGLDRSYGWAVAADPQLPERAYFAVSPSAMKAHSHGDARAAIFRTDDARIWRRLEGGLPQPLDHMPYALLTHPGAPGYLLAGLDDGTLWETEDAGETWRTADLSFTAIHRSLVGI
jgi:photosystem II stability/assembly factor-like uncharacterized protein